MAPIFYIQIQCIRNCGYILLLKRKTVTELSQSKIPPFQGLRVRHGSQERVFRLEFVSNQEFTDAEYSKWIDATNTACIPMPTKENIQQKQTDIKEALHYEFNEQDIERIVS